MKNADPVLFRFDRFSLDPRDRRLCRDGEAVELNARYLDALTLMVSEPGRLITKTRFHDEIWRGVPVTDEALTQCIRTLRRQLGDDAGRPRFIETAPKHGYRFIAPVERLAVDATAQPAAPSSAAPAARPGVSDAFIAFGRAGLLGGSAAGLLGGIFYGLAAGGGSAGALSTLVVLTTLTVLLGAVGGAGVTIGMATARLASGPEWARSIAGGALGGMVTGAVAKLIGLDALGLLFGGAPAQMTGALEGFLLGAAIGLGSWLSRREEPVSPRRAAAIGAGIGLAVGGLIHLFGGRLMAGSLDGLARSFPGSRIRLDGLGQAIGEPGYGLLSQLIVTGLEAAAFTACVVVAVRALTPAERSRPS